MVKIDMTKDMKALEDVKEEVEQLKGCYKFGPRIATLEGSAKSDLIAVTRRLNEMLSENKKNLKRSEAMKLIYSMSSEIGRTMMDPVKHRSDFEPTHEKPKLKTEV